MTKFRYHIILNLGKKDKTEFFGSIYWIIRCKGSVVQNRITLQANFSSVTFRISLL